MPVLWLYVIFMMEISASNGKKKTHVSNVIAKKKYDLKTWPEAPSQPPSTSFALTSTNYANEGSEGLRCRIKEF